MYVYTTMLFSLQNPFKSDTQHHHKMGPAIQNVWRFAVHSIKASIERWLPLIPLTAKLTPMNSHPKSSPPQTTKLNQKNTRLIRPPSKSPCASTAKRGSPDEQLRCPRPLGVAGHRFGKERFALGAPGLLSLNGGLPCCQSTLKPQTPKKTKAFKTHITPWQKPYIYIFLQSFPFFQTDLGFCCGHLPVCLDLCRAQTAAKRRGPCLGFQEPGSDFRRYFMYFIFGSCFFSFKSFCFNLTICCFFGSMYLIWFGGILGGISFCLFFLGGICFVSLAGGIFCFYF